MLQSRSGDTGGRGHGCAGEDIGKSGDHGSAGGIGKDNRKN